MDKYMKMSDYFVGNMIPEDIVILDGGVATVIYTSEEAAAHAINSHDELVKNMQHYKQEAEQWEARATNEASRAKDLEADVERLRGENVALMKCRMAARDFFNCTVASGGTVLISSKSIDAVNKGNKASDRLEKELKATVNLVKQ